MKKRLIEAELWEKEDPADPSKSISAAWKVISRIGAACRYSGLTQNGEREYLLMDPKTGKLLASGRGSSTPEALCRAALAARSGSRKPEAFLASKVLPLLEVGSLEQVG